MATQSFADVMKSAKNGRQVASTRVCFSPDIARKIYELEVELEDAVRLEDVAKKSDEPNTKRRLAGSVSESTRIAGLMSALVDENPDAFFDLKFQALPRAEWTGLRNFHPPRDGVAEDGGLFNSETFGPAAVAACLIEPKPDDDVLAFLDDSLTSGEWERLTLIVWGLNEGSREAPKLDRALSILNGNANG